MFPKSPIIYKSGEYSKFKKIEWNRKIDENNVKKLLKENEKKFQLHKFPIIVTKDFKIIDGQHRFEVAKKLKSPVYYIVDGKDYSFQAVHSVNKAGRKHTLKDKIEMLYKAGDEGAKVIYRVFEIFESNFDIAVICSLLVSGSTGGSINESIDASGKIIINNYDDGVQILYCCSKLNIEDKYTQRVVFSFYKIAKHLKTKPINIVNQINKNIFLWKKPKTKASTLNNLIECYNYWLKSGQRIDYQFMIK